MPGQKDGRGYLLPSDAHADTAEINGFPIDVLYGNLAKLNEARSVTMYLDACFSGDSPGGTLVRSASPVYVEASLPAQTHGRFTVLTAASKAQLASWDEEAGHGLFTHHLLDALYGSGDGDRDGRVTAREVKRYLDRHLTRAARRTEAPTWRRSSAASACFGCCGAGPGSIGPGACVPRIEAGSPTPSIATSGCGWRETSIEGGRDPAGRCAMG